MTTVARARGLVCRVGGAAVLDGVDVSVAEGGSVGLIGANGSGRTTLLQILATLRAPDAGTLEIAGVDARRSPLAARAHVMYVGGAIPGSAGLRVREYLDFVGNARHGRAGRRAATTEAALQRSQLPADARIEQLSPGVRRQLALTVALLAAPRLLLLDDPFAPLDQIARGRFLAWVGEVRAAGTAVVTAVNSAADADSLCSTVVRMEAGRLGPATAAAATASSLRASVMPVGGV